MPDTHSSHRNKWTTNNIFFSALIFLLLSSVCLPVSLTAGETVDFESTHFDLEKLADGVYAAIHKLGGGAVCNGGIIDLGGRTVIFDPFLSLGAARDLKTAAEALCSGPITFVVNSHSHSDHVLGNMIFTQDAAIIATEKARQDLMKGVDEYLTMVRETAPKQYESLKAAYETETDPAAKRNTLLWLGYYESLAKDAPELQIVPPDTTFTEKMVLSGSERTAELIALEHSHSSSDLVLYLPAEEILFTGDVVFYKMHPYVGDSDPYLWIKTLEMLQSWDIKIVVPGHGPVSDASVLSVMADYLVMLDKSARNLLDERISPDFADEMPIPKAFADWDFGNFYAGSVKFMMRYVSKKRLEIK
jgi:glyoxylase-like metal-dependent hydrolase (beta-lactamase superfamily II)